MPNINLNTIGTVLNQVSSLPCGTYILAEKANTNKQSKCSK